MPLNSVSVPVMQIRVMGMPMPHRLVAMPVRMRLRYGGRMDVLVMLIVHMAVLVLQCAMRMFVLVPFGQMQPEPETHQDRG